MATETITAQFVQQFDTALRTQVQQKDSRLMKTAVDRGTITGSSFTINALGALGLLDENTERLGDTLWSDIQFLSRVVPMRDYFKALPLDPFDIPKMLVNPVTGGQYMQELINARNRRIDNLIYLALIGTINSTDGSTAFTLPSTQKIVAGGTGLTKAKVIQAKTMFRANEADEQNGQKLYMLYNSVALGQILSDTTLTSADFLAGQMLQEGKMNNWMGFEWIPYEGLNNVSSTYTTVAYTEQAVHFGRAIESGSVDKRPDKRNAWQVSLQASYGAGRQDEKKVVQIDHI